MEGLFQFISDMGRVMEGYGMSMLRGMGLTIVIAVAGTFFGCLIGFGAGIIQYIPARPGASLPKRAALKLVKAVVRAYVEFFRGTPLMLQAMFIYYGSAYVFDLHMPYLPAGIAILSINTGAYMAETVRGGIAAIDPGQSEGAMAIGMTHLQTMVHVVLPQALRDLVPQIGNNLITNLKDSSLLSVISVSELFFAFKSAAAALYLYFPAATIAMILYLAMTLLASFLLRLWERALSGSANYEPAADSGAPAPAPVVRAGAEGGL